METTILCEIMERYGSDKGSKFNTSSHNYTIIYHDLFKSMKVTRVFELGLGTNNTDIPSNMGIHGRPGASLYGWAEYFPNAAIFGADIDKGCLFQTDRIRTFYCDQTDTACIEALWKEPLLEEGFDIIIDDGHHVTDSNRIFFEASIHKLKVGGYYIIEDIALCMVPEFLILLELWKKKYTNLNIAIFSIPNANPNDNRIMVFYRMF